MKVISPANSNFPCTSALPLVGRITSPTCSKVKTIAILAFAALLAIPLIATVITLILDGAYNVYKCAYPNLKTRKLAHGTPPRLPLPQTPLAPNANEGQGAPLHDPALDGPQAHPAPAANNVEGDLPAPPNGVNNQRVIRRAPQPRFIPHVFSVPRSPSQIAQIASLHLPPPPMSGEQRVALTMNNRLNQLVNSVPVHAQFEVSLPGIAAQTISGAQIRSLLFQLPYELERIYALPVQQQQRASIHLNLGHEQISFKPRTLASYFQGLQQALTPQIKSEERRIDPQLSIAEARRNRMEGFLATFNSHAPALIVPRSPAAMTYDELKRIKAEQRYLALCTSSSSRVAREAQIDEDPIVLSPAEMLALIPAEQQSALTTSVNQFFAFFRDPGNTKKGDKYYRSLYETKAALDKQFPRWESKIAELKALSEQSLFAKYSYQVLNTLKYSGQTNQPVRMVYAHLVNNLRNALTVPMDEVQFGETKAILNFLCRAKFTEVHMYRFFKEFISSALASNRGLLTDFSFQTLAQKIHDANHQLENPPVSAQKQGFAQNLDKFKGTIGIGFDSTSTSNTPWLHSVQHVTINGKAKTISVLRHGTPTQDPNVAQAILSQAQSLAHRYLRSFVAEPEHFQVIPEYEAHLRATPNKTTLYVNHQRYDEAQSGPIDPEVCRSRAIQKLEAKHQQFQFLSLPLDGPLWGDLNELITDQVKTRILDSLITNRNGFALPQSVRANLAHHALKFEELLGTVHSLYFNYAPLRTVADKQTFIMLYFSELKDYFKIHLNIDFIASVCKDNKDRGNASALVDMVKNLVKLGKQNNPAALEEVFYTALAPFIIKNEAIIESRLQLGLQVINHLSKLTAAQLTLIQAQNSHLQITGQEIPKGPAGWAQMMGAAPFLANIDGMAEREERQIIHLDLQIAQESNLEKQIEKDLKRFPIIVDGNRILDLETLKHAVGDKPALMALMHQGLFAIPLEQIHEELGGNSSGMFVKDAPITEISVRLLAEGKWALEFKKSLVLYSPDSARAYSIMIDGIVNDQFKAIIVWGLSKS